MGNLHHSIGQLEGAGALFIAGKITTVVLATAVTSVATGDVSSPQALASDVSVTRAGGTNAAIGKGVYTLTIANFKGPVGRAVPGIAVGSPGTMIAVSAIPTYSGDTLSVAIVTGTAGTLADSDIYFQILAY